MAVRVIGITAAAQVVPAATNNAYTAGHTVGGVLTLTNVVNRTQGTATLQSLQLRDLAGQSAAIDVFFFRTSPTVTDRTAFAPTDAQLRECLGSVSIGSGDYVAAGAGKSVATLRNIGLAMKTAAAVDASGSTISQSVTSVFAVLVTRGTPNYGANAGSNLNFEAQFFVD
jgi:hypothetical protein